MKGLRQRVTTALIFGVVVIGSIFISRYTFFVLFGVIAFFCLWELYTHLLKDEHRIRHLIRQGWALLIGLLPLIMVSIHFFSGVYTPSYLLLAGFLVFILLFFGLLIFELFAKADSPFAHIGYTLLGLVYLGLPFALIPFIAFRSGLFNPSLVFCLFVMVWSNDVFAYFIGSLIGRTKLFPRISPNKTWEGSIGGFVGTLLIAAALSFIFSNEGLDMKDWLILGGLAAIFGSIGDLIESMLKRSLGIKDSGTLLPGHGGFLDRFDAFIFLIPFVTIYLLWIM